MNPKIHPKPKIGDLMYTFCEPTDEYGLEISDRVHLVVIISIPKQPCYVYTTMRCVTEAGVNQMVQYLDIHHTKEAAHEWYRKSYGDKTLKTFRGA